MIKKILSTVIPFILLLGSLPAQQNKSQIIEWEKIREAFEAYSRFPSADNSNRILGTVPKEFDNKTANLDLWDDTLNYIWEGGPCAVLKNQILKGDKLALRVSFRTLIISDGAFAEFMVNLIGLSIRPNPEGYLEEAKAFIKYAPGLDIVALDTVLPEWYGLPEEDPKEFQKEVQQRIRSLETVNRPDLIELRDRCIRRLIREIREH